jgi:hypothetical protein
LEGVVRILVSEILPDGSVIGSIIIKPNSQTRSILILMKTYAGNAESDIKTGVPKSLFQ